LQLGVLRFGFLQEREVGVGVFPEGEEIFVGAERPDWYHPENSGFFLFPADPESNNIRVFIVNSNVQQVKFL
jgi:hypothetical protein